MQVVDDPGYNWTMMDDAKAYDTIRDLVTTFGKHKRLNKTYVLGRVVPIGNTDPDREISDGFHAVKVVTSKHVERVYDLSIINGVAYITRTS